MRFGTLNIVCGLSVVLVLLIVVDATSALSLEDVSWSECPLHSEFHMPEGVKFFPRADLPSGRTFPVFLPLVDAINELNLKYNSTFRTKAECALIYVPLNHDDNSSIPITLFVKRLRFDPYKHAPRALWFLSGGPGSASDFFEFPMDILVKMLSGQFDIYTIDHRGTGRSSKATCTKTQAETAGSDEGISISVKEWTKYGCAQSFHDEWKGQSQYFSSKSAAIDVVKLVQAINIPQNQKTFIYGVSYGTVWVSRIIRYLQLNGLSNIISGYIMDGIVNVIGKKAPMGLEYPTKSGRLVLNLWDENFTAIGNAFMELCGGSKNRIASNQFVDPKKDKSLNSKLYDIKTECALKLGKKSNGDPVSFMKKVIENVYTKNTCPLFAKAFPLLELKTIFQTMLVKSSVRAFIPAFIYRMDRCDVNIDIPFLIHVKKVYMGGVHSNQLTLDSQVLQFHIMFSELWDEKVTLQQIFNEYNSSAISFGGLGVGMSTIHEVSKWPVYNLDPDYFEQPYETNVPILMMNGNMDPNTPLWSAISQQEGIQGSAHNLVIIPFAPHTTIIGPALQNSYIPAAMQVLANFISMETPNAHTVDISCLDLINFNTSGFPYYNERIYGIRNIYEDGYNGPTLDTQVSVYVLIGVVLGMLFFGCLVFGFLIWLIIRIRTRLRNFTKGFPLQEHSDYYKLNLTN